MEINVEMWLKMFTTNTNRKNLKKTFKYRLDIFFVFNLKMNKEVVLKL